MLPGGDGSLSSSPRRARRPLQGATQHESFCGRRRSSAKSEPRDSLTPVFLRASKERPPPPPADLRWPSDGGESPGSYDATDDGDPAVKRERGLSVISHNYLRATRATSPLGAAACAAEPTVDRDSYRVSCPADVGNRMLPNPRGIQSDGGDGPGINHEFIINFPH